MTCLSIIYHLPTYLFIYLPTYLSIYLSVYLSIYPFIHPSTYSSIIYLSPSGDLLQEAAHAEGNGNPVQYSCLEWVAISFSRGSSQRRDRTQVSRITDRSFPVSATRKPDLGNGGKGRGVCRQSWIPPLSVSGQARPQTWLGGGLGSRLPTSVSSTDSSELLAPTRHCPSPRVSMKMSERLSMEALCHPKWVSA